MRLRTTALALLFALLWALAPAALAGVSNSSGDNIQEGNNTSDSDQDGDANAGTVVGGQSVSVSAGRDANVKATNRGENNRLRPGNATADNSHAGHTGLASASQSVTITTGITNATATNIQEGTNEARYDQSADATVGDGIGGQVIGIKAGRNATVDASNDIDDVTIDIGRADADNDAAAFTGLVVASSGAFSVTAGINIATAPNVQEGDNILRGDQHADATTGDGVGGQIIGVDAEWNIDITADNTVDDLDVNGGRAVADNNSSTFTGQAFTTGGNVSLTADISRVTAWNVQEGNNTSDVDQFADASTGDAVGGQSIGATSDDGDVTIDASNLVTDSNLDSGDADVDNNAANFTGLAAATQSVLVSAHITFVSAGNIQAGDNDGEIDQFASSSTGDALGGQSISAFAPNGDIDLDADNETDNVNATTGDADSENDAALFVGLARADSVSLSAAISNVIANNAQVGTNTGNADQFASANTGDASVGQSIGATAGGSATLTLNNTTLGGSATSGMADEDNDQSLLIGLEVSLGAITVTSP